MMIMPFTFLLKCTILILTVFYDSLGLRDEDHLNADMFSIESIHTTTSLMPIHLL